MHREEDYLRFATELLELARRLDAIEQRHRDIHHHYVGALLLAGLQELAAIFGRPDQVELGLQQAADAFGHDLVIVGQQDSRSPVFVVHGNLTGEMPGRL